MFTVTISKIPFSRVSSEVIGRMTVWANKMARDRIQVKAGITYTCLWKSTHKQPQCIPAETGEYTVIMPTFQEQKDCHLFT